MASVLEERTRRKQEDELRTGGGTISAIGGTQSPQAQPQQQQQPQGSGRFTDLRKYLGANIGAGERMTERIGREGTQAAGRIQSGIGQKETDISGRVQDIRSGIEASKQAGKTAFEQAGKQDIDEQTQQQFRQLYGGQLGQQASGLDISTDDIESQLGTLRDMAQATKTEGGRFNLLSQAFGSPTQRYTRGQQRLDELFLQATPAAGQLSQRFGTEAQRSQQELARLQESLKTQKTDLEKLATTEQEALKDLFQKGIDVEGLETDLSQMGLEDVESAISGRAKELTSDEALQNILNMQQRLSEGQITQKDFETLQKFGIPLSENMDIYDIDLSSYMSSPEAIKASLGQAQSLYDQGILDPFATQEEATRFKALQSLLGKDPTRFAGDVGTFQPYTFDSNLAQQALADRAAEAQAVEKMFDEEGMKKIFSSWGPKELENLKKSADRRKYSPEVREWLNMLTDFQERGFNLGDTARFEELARYVAPRYSQIFGTKAGQFTRDTRGEMAAVGNYLNEILNIIPKSSSTLKRRQLQIIPEDLEMGGQFNVT